MHLEIRNALHPRKQALPFALIAMIGIGDDGMTFFEQLRYQLLADKPVIGIDF